MIIMVGSMTAGRHGTGKVAEDLYLIHEQQTKSGLGF